MEAVAFNLPNGAYIMFCTHSGDVGATFEDERKWMSADTVLVLPDGSKKTLLSADYEEKRGLRTILFDEDGTMKLGRIFEYDNRLKIYTVEVTSVTTVEVEANTREEAEEKACSIAWEHDADEINAEIKEVEEIEDDD